MQIPYFCCVEKEICRRVLGRHKRQHSLLNLQTCELVTFLNLGKVLNNYLKAWITLGRNTPGILGDFVYHIYIFLYRIIIFLYNSNKTQKLLPKFSTNYRKHKIKESDILRGQSACCGNLRICIQIPNTWQHAFEIPAVGEGDRRIQWLIQPDQPNQ